jgi:sugar O-acyltransferase (sialic acid O-acetyltransferase NeuD family)
VTRDIVIVGAGGFGREVLQYVRDTFTDPSAYRVKGFLDDAPHDLAGVELGADLLGDTLGYEVRAHDVFLVAVGSPAHRRSLSCRLAERGARFLTLVHPLAYVARSARLGAGCIICPFATVGNIAQLGEQVVLTFYASVGHDARVGACSVLSPYAVTNGGSVLGDGVLLGARATVNPGKRVGANAKVVAGAVVYHDVPANALARGNAPRADASLHPYAAAPARTPDGRARESGGGP